MGALLVAMGVPTLLFGIFALLALRFGAESRPWFDERPVLDDRPNWFPIARTIPAPAAEEDDVDSSEGPPEPEPAPVPVRARSQPPRRPAAHGAPAAPPARV
jgi:hypothetical protein